MLSLMDLLQVIITPLIQGLAVAAAAFLIPGRMGLGEVFGVGITAAATMFVLDRLVPEVGIYFRKGAGFGIGANMVGFPAAL